MMNYGQNTVYMKNLQDGSNFEAKGNFNFAIDRYSMAFNIAKDAEDSAAKTPFTRIRVLKAKMHGVEPDYEEIEKEYESLEENNFKGFSLDSDDIM